MQQAIQRGLCPQRGELAQAPYVTNYNLYPRPFIWVRHRRTRSRKALPPVQSY